MIFNELEPTERNIISTLEKNIIGRNKDLFTFCNMLNFMNGACSIALDGSWGSGKTFFVKQAKMIFDANNQNNKLDASVRNTIFAVQNKFGKTKNPECLSHVTVYYDAWENDNMQDPVLSIIYSIMKEFDYNFDFSDDISFATFAANIFDFFTGRNLEEVIKTLRGDDPLSEIRKTDNLKTNISNFFDSLMAERGDRLIIFIDELDRCSPSYAVKLLERIKHYFSNEKITFVFSINAKELQHTVKKYYGESFDAVRYLDRFFDLRITLPPENKELFYQSINFSGNFFDYDIVCETVISKFNLSMRERIKYIGLTKIAAYTPTHEGRRYGFSISAGLAENFSLNFIIPVMIGLKFYDNDMYDSFISGKDSSAFLNIMNDVLDKCNFEFAILLSTDETFYDDNSERKVITIEDKIREVYNTIFATTYSRDKPYIEIGKCRFGGDLKDWLLRVVSALSEYSTLDVE